MQQPGQRFAATRAYTIASSPDAGDELLDVGDPVFLERVAREPRVDARRIRAALGAEPRKLAKMFLRHGLVLSAVGAVVGLVAAVALARLMSSLLFGISPLDPAAYVAALVVIVLAAALATYLPARRAAQLDPIETLRAE